MAGSSPSEGRRSFTSTILNLVAEKGLRCWKTADIVLMDIWLLRIALFVVRGTSSMLGCHDSSIFLGKRSLCGNSKDLSREFGRFGASFGKRHEKNHFQSYDHALTQVVPPIVKPHLSRRGLGDVYFDGDLCNMEKQPTLWQIRAIVSCLHLSCYTHSRTTISY